MIVVKPCHFFDFKRVMAQIMTVETAASSWHVQGRGSVDVNRKKTTSNYILWRLRVICRWLASVASPRYWYVLNIWWLRDWTNRSLLFGLRQLAMIPCQNYLDVVGTLSCLSTKAATRRMKFRSFARHPEPSFRVFQSLAAAAPDEMAKGRRNHRESPGNPWYVVLTPWLDSPGNGTVNKSGGMHHLKECPETNGNTSELDNPYGWYCSVDHW